MVKAAVLDLGIGNLFSVIAGLRRAGCDAELASHPSRLGNSDLIVLPGVGSFEAAASKLDPLRAKIKEQVRDGRLLFGICLGYQLMFEGSEEGRGLGLGLFKGYVKRLPNSVRVPHIGWNSLFIFRWHEILDGVKDGSYFYFAHSFYPIAEQSDVCAFTEYGTMIASVATNDNVIGVQFHPERSGKIGSLLLSNLVKLAKK